jgi:hypothetical protein
VDWGQRVDSRRMGKVDRKNGEATPLGQGLEEGSGLARNSSSIGSKKESGTSNSPLKGPNSLSAPGA